MDVAVASSHPGSTSDQRTLLEEARMLVDFLVQPHGQSPAQLRAIQTRLQELQKCPHGWIVADGLLSATDSDVRFFGALTFMVKINQDWNELGRNDVQDLTARLVSRFVVLVNSGEKALVIRKLISTLVSLFVKPNSPWSRAIWNLAVSLNSGSYIPEPQASTVDFESVALQALNVVQIVSLLRFSSTLAEEGLKWAQDSTRSDNPLLVNNVQDAFTLCNFVLRHVLHQYASGNATSDTNTGPEAIQSYHSWLAVRRTCRLRDLTQSSLTSPPERLSQCLNVPSLFKSAAEALTEMLDTSDQILTKEHLNAILGYLVGEVGASRVFSLLKSDYGDENMAFLELLLAYSKAVEVELLTGVLTQPHEAILSYLDTLFHGPGYAGVDDKISPSLLDWWTEAADELQSFFVDNQDFRRAKQYLARTALNCFSKLLYPEPEILREWDDDEKIEFSVFRRDACDFLLAVYPILGMELVQVFQQRATLALRSKDWTTFEAAIYCLAQLSEAVDENQHADQCLNDLFFASEFVTLCTDGGVQIAPKARQTLVDMLGQYRFFFERTQQLLPRVLTFLFASLDVPASAPAASRSISSLCKSCRTALTSDLPVFLNLFDQFRSKPTTEVSHTMERVLEGIAAVIGAQETDVAKAECLERLLSFFQQQAMIAREEVARGDTEGARNRGQRVLRSVAGIGRGLRTDGDGVVDLDRRDTQPYLRTFWNSGKGRLSQSLIMECLHALIQDFPIDVGIIEAACDIMKAGYTETTGPYVFDPATTVDFVKSIPLGSAGADLVMNTASAFLASHSTHAERIYEETVTLITHVYDMFCYMEKFPEHRDPQVANSGIDFLTRLLPRYHRILFSLTTPPTASTPMELNYGDGTNLYSLSTVPRPAILPMILEFTLHALQGPDPLPLRSASQFWTSVLSLHVEPRTNFANQEDQLIYQAIIEPLPALCRVLITQIAGHCARSDLDHLSEVLKKLVFKQLGLARVHLGAALAGLGMTTVRNGYQSSPQSQGTNPPLQEDQARFLAMVIAARGSRETNQLVRSFWVKCRGAEFEYT